MDESGNQVAVFGRRGSRPLDLAERQRLYRLPPDGRLFTVPDIADLAWLRSVDPPRQAAGPRRAASAHSGPAVVETGPR